MANPTSARRIGEVQGQFCFDDKQEDNPWPYARYYGSMAANIYADVDWSFFKAGEFRDELKTVVIHEEADDSAAWEPDKDPMRIR